MDLFVYGTLRNAELMEAVSGSQSIRIEASLIGFRVAPVANHIVPMIMRADDARANGQLYQDLDPYQMQRLDLYEGAFGYTLIPVNVETSKGLCQAKMYMPPQGQLSGDGDWSLAKWENGHLSPTLLTVEEIFSLDPLPTPDTLRASWPVIEKRAWAKHRARTSAAGGAAVRHAPQKDDVAVPLQEPPLGDFFRLQGIEVDHRRFDGTVAKGLRREVFMGVDASLILPYDAKRDRILLVEQLRMGPLMRADPNPWTLEPIAGMIDARETPLDAAIREGMEETGLTFDRIEKMPDHYPSPGASTDFFYCFLGLCDLPSLDAYSGGLAAEAEDLRLHVLPFDDAMSLIDTGEIRIGVLLTMLYWLARERERLRSNA